MRPTGRLHIGNYFGALQNWVKLQEDPSNECFFFIADWHSLTSDYADTSQIAQNTIEVMIDFLAGGLDPAKSVIFLQSSVPEHAELHLLLSMITPLGWLERVPTYKEQIKNITGKDLHTYGFLGYPVLQTADIVIYGEPGMSLAVPVGEDQVAHVELSREIVRRFNLAYAKLQLPNLPPQAWSGLISKIGTFSSEIHEELRKHAIAEDVPYIVRTLHDVFRTASIQEKGYYVTNEIGTLDQVLCEPDVMLTQAKRVPGTDGRKMSKSYGNAIELGESDESIRV